jgi:hypothetical protein
MNNRRFAFSVGNYEHVRDLLSGEVRGEGIDIILLRTSAWRAGKEREAPA